MDFSDLLIKRRSVREYEDKPVTHELILEIIRNCTMAPSSGNGQPWRFVVVHDKQWIEKLSDESKRSFVEYIEKNPEAPIKRYEAVLKNESFNVFYNAPCVVYIIGPKDVSSMVVDCTLAASYFMLSAADRGLGTCWIGLGGNITDPEVRKHLGLSENHNIVAPIAVGYPKKIPEATDRNKTEILKVIE